MSIFAPKPAQAVNFETAKSVTKGIAGVVKIATGALLCSLAHTVLLRKKTATNPDKPSAEKFTVAEALLLALFGIVAVYEGIGDLNGLRS